MIPAGSRLIQSPTRKVILCVMILQMVTSTLSTPGETLGDVLNKDPKTGTPQVDCTDDEAIDSLVEIIITVVLESTIYGMLISMIVLSILLGIFMIFEHSQALSKLRGRNKSKYSQVGH